MGCCDALRISALCCWQTCGSRTKRRPGRGGYCGAERAPWLEILCHLAQVFPELKPLLRGSNAVSRPAVGNAREWRRAAHEVALLQRGGRAQAEWIALAEALAGRRRRGGEHEHHGRKSVGWVGGYVSEARHLGAWPADVAGILRRSGWTGEERVAEWSQQGGGAPLLSVVRMPITELFGSWAVAAAVAAARARTPRAVVAMGNCDPAAAALNAARSANPQMPRLLRGARSLISQWLAVYVPCGTNGDADGLSHPAHQLSAVRTDA
eukprot:3883332-Pleurochrysis_carterae.AAC.2